MSNIFHKTFVGDDNHAITANPNTTGAPYADIASRDADSAFNTTSANVDKVIRVTDADGSGNLGYFILTSITPTWKEITNTTGDEWTELSDTPSSISAGLIVQGNSAGTALEFGQALDTTDSPTFLSALLSGAVNNVSLDLSSTTGALRLNRLTTTQRDALTPLQGMSIFNTTTLQIEDYNGTAWLGAIGPDEWTELTDTPGSISAGLSVQGNVGGTALEFGQALNAGDSPTFLDVNVTGEYKQDGATILTGDSTLFNLFAGFDAGGAITTGSGITAIGHEALKANTEGDNNTALGNAALKENTTGTDNVGVGGGALENNILGRRNIVIGVAAGASLVSAALAGENTLIGYNTGGGLTTGVQNTIIGANVSGLSSSLSNNIILADGAGVIRLQINSSGNIIIGADFATDVNIVSSSNAYQIGGTTILTEDSSIFNLSVGFGAGVSHSGAAMQNVSVGTSALNANLDGGSNVAIGYQALLVNTSGVSNTAVGDKSLKANILGERNTALGSAAGTDIVSANTTGDNTLIGYNCGAGITTGIQNTVIGANVTGLSPTLSNNVILADGSGAIRLQFDSSGDGIIGGRVEVDDPTGAQDAATKNYVDTLTADISCKVTKSADQTTSNNTDTIVTWDQEDYDTDGMHDNATNNSRITIITAGKYSATVQFVWIGDSNGDRVVRIMKNSANVGVINKLASGSSQGIVTFVGDLVVNDILEIEVRQTSGGNLDLKSGTMYFEAHKIN